MDDLLVWFKQVMSEYGVALFSFGVAFIMSMLRTISVHGKADWIESLMCAFFTMGAWSILVYLGIPEVLAVGIGALFGYKGTSFINHRINKKFDDEDKKNENQ